MTVFGEPLDEIKFDLPEREKAAFKRLCFQNDETMAQALRKFIRAYIAHGIRQPHEGLTIYLPNLDRPD